MIDSLYSIVPVYSFCFPTNCTITRKILSIANSLTTKMLLISRDGRGVKHLNLMRYQTYINPQTLCYNKLRATAGF